MATRHIAARDVKEGRVSRLRLLAPLRYLAIRHPEKDRYDWVLPLAIGAAAWAGYMIVSPKIQLFGEAGLLRFARDLLIMSVPFMVGALAAVSMGMPGDHIEKRMVGVELILDCHVLTMRQFLCYLLGYLCFLGLVTLAAVVGASLLQPVFVSWTAGQPIAHSIIHAFGALIFSCLLSFLTVTVFWSLYFLTEVANRK